jgi:hypothetical protein
VERVIEQIRSQGPTAENIILHLDRASSIVDPIVKAKIRSA